MSNVKMTIKKLSVTAPGLIRNLILLNLKNLIGVITFNKVTEKPKSLKLSYLLGSIKIRAFK